MTRRFWRGQVRNLGYAVSLSGLALTCATSASAARQAVMQRLDEVRPVHFEQPVTLHRDGRALLLQDALLVRITVADSGPFIPRDAPGPTVMLGHGVCSFVRSPLTSSTLVVLCPKPEPAEANRIWLLDYGDPSRLDGKLTQQAYQRAQASRSIELRDAKVSGGETFVDWTALSNAVNKKKAP